MKNSFSFVTIHKNALINHLIKNEQGSEVGKVVRFHNKKGLHLSHIINNIKKNHSQILLSINMMVKI